MEEQEQFSDNQSDQQGAGTAEVVIENNAPKGSDLSEERIRRIVAEETSKAYRATQSMMDKKARQIAVAAQKQVAEIKASGGVMSPEAEKAFVQNQVTRFMDAQTESENEPAQAQTRQGAEPSLDSNYFAKRMERINKKHDGITILQNDPEAKKLDDIWAQVNAGGDVEDFFEEYDKQVSAKSRRVGTPPQARIASVAGSGGNNLTSKESLTAELEKLLENPTNNLKKIMEIKEKLKT